MAWGHWDVVFPRLSRGAAWKRRGRATAGWACRVGLASGPTNPVWTAILRISTRSSRVAVQIPPDPFLWTAMAVLPSRVSITCVWTAFVRMGTGSFCGAPQSSWVLSRQPGGFRSGQWQAPRTSGQQNSLDKRPLARSGWRDGTVQTVQMSAPAPPLFTRQRELLDSKRGVPRQYSEFLM